MLCYLANARNLAESTEQSRFPSPVANNRDFPLQRHRSLHSLRDSRHMSLKMLTVQEPMGLSWRCRLLVLASHRMALTRKRKNPSWITQETEIFSIFAWLVPTLVPSWKHNSRFRVFCCTICWFFYWLTFVKHLVERKLQFLEGRNIGKWNFNRKCKFTILQNEMASCTYKDSILSCECLAYWSRWLELL